MKKYKILVVLLTVLMISSSFTIKKSPPTDFKEIKYYYLWSLFNGTPEKNYKKYEIHFFISNIIRTEEHDFEGLQNAFMKHMASSNKWAVRAYLGEKAGGYQNIEDASSARKIMIKENIQKGYIIHYVNW
ncbi:MAG: hypothetical protein HXX14_08830 [Bacteroidetes bacterium]|nr:hypothetical protein [Bacteroidota bacterium]